MEYFKEYKTKKRQETINYYSAISLVLILSIAAIILEYLWIIKIKKDL